MIEYLYQALHSENGLELETNNVQSLKGKLIKARAKADDPNLDQLLITPSRFSPKTHLWIVKKEKLDGQNKGA